MTETEKPMGERLKRAVDAALAEMDRQYQEPSAWGGPYMFHADKDGNLDPRDLGVDGNMDLVKVIEAALKAADESPVMGTPITEAPKLPHSE